MDFFNLKMKKNYIILLLTALLFSSCGSFTNLYKHMTKDRDYDYMYEAAKEYYVAGDYDKAILLLNDVITILKGSDRGEESVYMLAMSYLKNKEYDIAAQSFQQYYTSYPRGTYTEFARFYAGKALWISTPEAQLDQSDTYQAIQELQLYLEFFPNSRYREEAQNIIFDAQDKLVEKELNAAKLYYNLGSYLGNNFQSCVICAQNALKDYPYTRYREDLALLVMKAKYELAYNSVLSRKAERYRDAVDECYAFKNEYSESANVKLADELLKKSEAALKDLPDDLVDDE
jgi:outer membrane protein assembly factor BamD